VNTVEINGLDIQDITAIIERRKRRYLAILLSDIEEILGSDHEKYGLVRKTILDSFNDYARSVFRALFGEEVEGLTFR